MPYRPYINKIVQTSRADDIRPYAIMLICNIKTWLCQPARHTEFKLIYNTKNELHTAVHFYYSDFYYISVLARGTRSWFGGGIAEGYRADSAQGFGQIPLAQ